MAQRRLGCSASDGAEHHGCVRVARAAALVRGGAARGACTGARCRAGGGRRRRARERLLRPRGGAHRRQLRCRGRRARPHPGGLLRALVRPLQTPRASGRAALPFPLPSGLFLRAFLSIGRPLSVDCLIPHTILISD